MKARRAPDERGAGYPSQRRCPREASTISTTVRSQHDPSPLLISVHPQRSTVRVAPSGELDLVNAAALQAQLDELRAAGFEHIVLDLRELTFIDSSGVRLIIREDRVARSTGRRFSLIAGAAPIQRVLTICGLAARLHFEDPFGSSVSRPVVSADVASERPRLGVAFQGYVAQLRRQGRSTSRLGAR